MPFNPEAHFLTSYNQNPWKLGLSGLINANLPSFASAMGCFFTFQDRPYAWQLAASQLIGPTWQDGVWKSAIGIFSPFIMKWILGMDKNPKRNRNRGKGRNPLFPLGNRNNGGGQANGKKGKGK